MTNKHENIKNISTFFLLPTMLWIEMSSSIIEKIKKDYRNNGVLVPIVVGYVDGRRFILDVEGHHRWEAAKRLHLREVPIIEIEITDTHYIEILFVDAAQAIEERFN